MKYRLVYRRRATRSLARIWLAADDGTIWMYLPGSGLQRMAKVVRTSNQGPPGVVVSGPCR